MTDLQAGLGEELRERVFLVVVDKSPEMAVALRYAALRARHTGGRVALLYLTEPAEPGPWMSVEELVREERRQEAEETLAKWGALVQELTGKMPMMYVREGEGLPSLLQVINEEPAIQILVLAAAPGDFPGPLIQALPSHISKLRVPVTIVPGGLTDAALAGLT